jgi:type IV pilus assembly protein PilV
MKPLSARKSACQRGVGLIEVMIALVVLSVGILAILGMQISGKQANYDAVQRTTAAHLASDLIERMRANTSSLPSYLTGAVIGGGSLDEPDPACDDDADPCTSVEMAAADLYHWEQSLDGQSEVRDGVGTGGLVKPRACLDGPVGGGSGAFELTLVWRGAGELDGEDIAACGGALNGTNDYGSAADPDSDTYRRKATFTFFITR